MDGDFALSYVVLARESWMDGWVWSRVVDLGGGIEVAGGDREDKMEEGEGVL